MHPTYTSQGAQSKESACQAGDAGQFLGQEEPLEREMLIYSSVLAWNIPWREETGGLQATGGHKRVRHDLVTKKQQKQPESTC